MRGSATVSGARIVPVGGWPSSPNTNGSLGSALSGKTSQHRAAYVEALGRLRRLIAVLRVPLRKHSERKRRVRLHAWGRTRRSCRWQTAALEECMAKLPAAEIAEFDMEFARHHDELYSWALWGAAFLLQNGCGDDCFEYFRSWVIAQGPDYFEAVRDDPSALVDGRLTDEEEVAEAELLSYVAADTYAYLCIPLHTSPGERCGTTTRTTPASSTSTNPLVNSGRSQSSTPCSRR